MQTVPRVEEGDVIFPPFFFFFFFVDLCCTDFQKGLQSRFFFHINFGSGKCIFARISIFGAEILPKLGPLELKCCHVKRNFTWKWHLKKKTECITRGGRAWKRGRSEWGIPLYRWHIWVPPQSVHYIQCSYFRSNCENRVTMMQVYFLWHFQSYQ